MKYIPEKEFISDEQRAVYESPAVIYEGVISTRAGSPLSNPSVDDGLIDPEDLFGD